MAALYKTESNLKIMKLKSLFNSFKNEVEQTTEVVETTKNEEHEEEVVIVETEEEKKKREEEEAAAAASESSENFVTQEQFSALMAKLDKLIEATDTAIDEVKEEAKEIAVQELENLKTGLKRTTAQATRGNNSVTGDAANGYVDKYAKFRAEMKEIETKTRN